MSPLCSKEFITMSSSQQHAGIFKASMVYKMLAMGHAGWGGRSWSLTTSGKLCISPPLLYTSFRLFTQDSRPVKFSEACSLGLLSWTQLDSLHWMALHCTSKLLQGKTMASSEQELDINVVRLNSHQAQNPMVRNDVLVQQLEPNDPHPSL